MKARIVVLAGLVLALGLLAPVTAGSRVRAQEPVDCRGLQAYADQYHAVGQTYQQAMAGVDTSNIEGWTATEAVTWLLREVAVAASEPVTVASGV